MSLEKASSSSSHQYKTASDTNTARNTDIQIDTQATYDEFLKSSEVFVNEEPDISNTTISTNGLSTCSFFLINFYLEDNPYCLLIHHEKLCNSKMSAPHLLTHLLDDIVYHIKKILRKKFDVQQPFKFTNIKNINLLVGGGTPTEHNNIREAFGLLITRNQSTSDILLNLLKQNQDCEYLVNKLFNHTTIFSPTSYFQSVKELDEQRKNPNKINCIPPPDLWLLNNCQKKEYYLGIRWDGNNYHIDLALMKIDTSKLHDVNQYQWQYQINQIGILKNSLSNEPGILEKLQKALCINPNALYILPSVSELIDYYWQRAPYNDDIDEDEDEDDTND
ncbi:unnamed protein product [Rotaria socialis]|uniref:Uncharacterized protein n=2 Tax=Rotaria TaxID=231623 RepID=A0A817R8A5_9BILA|nr:unnamed protein product [Rotaria socialis]CAF3244028.1 unnamed protein product [Rotaria socialis]CAF4326141.1 unnamed protein product [Rotaria socialis]CAF4451394.1 unnamed protein product [Rotaria socialis]